MVTGRGTLVRIANYFTLGWHLLKTKVMIETSLNQKRFEIYILNLIYGGRDGPYVEDFQCELSLINVLKEVLLIVSIIFRLVLMSFRFDFHFNFKLPRGRDGP